MYKGEDRKIISPPVMPMSRIDLRLLSVTFIIESGAQRTLENLSLISLLYCNFDARSPLLHPKCSVSSETTDGFTKRNACSIDEIDAPWHNLMKFVA